MGRFSEALKKKGYKPGSKVIDDRLKQKGKPAIKDMKEWEQVQMEISKSIKNQETLVKVLKGVAKFGVSVAKAVM